MKERRDPLGPASAQAQRMRYLRIAEGFENAQLWAAHVGLTPTLISNVENGYPLSKIAAIGLAKRIPGLTIDYLLMGRMEALAFDLRKRIEAAEMSESGKDRELAVPKPAKRNTAK